MSRAASVVAFELARDTRVLAGAAAGLERDLAEGGLDLASLREAVDGVRALAAQVARLGEELEAALGMAPEPQWTQYLPGGTVDALDVPGAGARVGEHAGGGFYWAAWASVERIGPCRVPERTAARIAAIEWLRQRGALPREGGAT